MKKSNQREVIVKLAPPEQDSQRLERLVGLLALGLERQINQQSKPDNTLDLRPNVLLNTPTPKEPIVTENK
jgi:hypothetical protein